MPKRTKKSPRALTKKDVEAELRQYRANGATKQQARRRLVDIIVQMHPNDAGRQGRKKADWFKLADKVWG